MRFQRFSIIGGLFHQLLAQLNTLHILLQNIQLPITVHIKTQLSNKTKSFYNHVI